MTDDPDQPLRLDGPRAWRAWLEQHHDHDGGVWVALAKKGHPGLTYPQAVEEALCFGWIDGQMKGRDEAHFVQRFTRRRPRSRWSLANTQAIERLTAEGRMHPAGLAEVERAKADGRWQAAYPGSRDAVPPDDLAAAIAASPAAAEAWPRWTASNRFAAIYRVGDAKRPQTRVRRIADVVARLERGDPYYA